MSKRQILAFTGLPKTGKTTLAEYLELEHGFYPFEGSSYIKVMAADEGIQLRSREDYTSYYLATQQQFGKSWLARTMLERPEPRLLNTGLRNRADFNHIRSSGGLIIALAAPTLVCLERTDASDPKNPSTVEEYETHTELENSGTDDGYGLHVGWTVSNADITLDTSAPITDSYQALDDIVASMGEV